MTVTSTADSMAFTNIRFEVGGYSNLYFDVPEMVMTGLENSVSETDFCLKTHSSGFALTWYLGDVIHARLCVGDARFA